MHIGFVEISIGMVLQNPLLTDSGEGISFLSQTMFFQEVRAEEDLIVFSS